MNINLFRNAYGVFRGIRDAGDEAEAIVAIYYALARIEEDKQVAFTNGFDQGYGSGNEAARQATADAFMPGIMRDIEGPDHNAAVFEEWNDPDPSHNYDASLDYDRVEQDYSDVENIPLFGAVAGFIAEEFDYSDEDARDAAAEFMRDHWLSKPHDLYFSDDVMQEALKADAEKLDQLTVAEAGHTHAVQLPCDVEPSPSADYIVTSGGTVFPLADFDYNTHLARAVGDFDNANVRR